MFLFTSRADLLPSRFAALMAAGSANELMTVLRPGR